MSELARVVEIDGVRHGYTAFSVTGDDEPLALLCMYLCQQAGTPLPEPVDVRVENFGANGRGIHFRANGKDYFFRAAQVWNEEVMLTKPDTVLEDLWKAMSYLYAARYKACGPDGPPDDRYPQMDQETFSEIALLQDQLQRLLTRLEKKDGPDPGR